MICVNYRPMTGAHLEPTLKGMVELSSDKKTITMGMAGMYKVSMELNHQSCTGAAHYLYMRVNGSNIVTKVGSNYGGYGLMSRTLRLKKGDKITFYTNYHYGTDQQHSCFTIEKLP